MSGLLRLYPRRWRERYGEELEELLAERPPSVRHRFDIARGALDAHLHPQLVDPDRVVDRWWLAPLAGFGLLIFGVLVVAASPERFDEYGSYRDANMALIPLLGAIALLIVGIARLAQLLPTELGALRVIGFVGVSAGVVWAIMPWVGILGVTFFGATAVVALGAWRAAVIPGRLAGALVVALGVPTALFAAIAVLPWWAMREAGGTAFTLFGSVILIWPLVALCVRNASRADGRRTGGTVPAV